MASANNGIVQAVEILPANPVLSDATDIIAFSLTEQTGPATIDAVAHTVDIEVANGTVLTALVPTIGVSAGATINPTSGTADDFSSDVTYTVTAEDGVTTEDWTVTVTEAAPPVWEAHINFQDKGSTPPTGYLRDYGKEFGAATSVATILGQDYDYGWKRLSDGVAQDVSDDAANNSNGAGRNRSPGNYASLSDQEKLEVTLVHFQGDNIRNNSGAQSWAGQPRGEEVYWEMEVPNGTYEVTISLGDFANGSLDSRHSATIEGITIIPAFAPTAGEIQQETMVVEVTDGLLTMNGVGGYNTKINYLDIVTTTAPAVSAQALTFTPNSVNQDLPEGTATTVASTLAGTGAGPVSLTINDVVPLGGNTNIDQNDWLSLPAAALGSLDFPVDATSLSEGDSRDDDVIATAKGFTPAILALSLNVTAPLSEENDILTFVLADETGAATIDAVAHTVDAEVMNGTSLTTLFPTITMSAGATISPESDTEVDFTNPVDYTVTAEDGTEQIWTVTVTEESLLSNDNDIVTFSFAEETGPATIDDINHTVAIEVAFETVLTSLTPTITVSALAGISPASGVAQDFSTPMDYTVTAEDGSEQIWTVTVTEAPGCSPVSLLACADIPLALPVDFQFTGSEGGLFDGINNDIGFTMVDNHSEARMPEDGPPTYPGVNGFEPSQLEIAGNNLTITANRGIAFRKPGGSTNNNNQVNTLGVGLQNIATPIIIETKLLGITTGPSAAQAGLWFGIDEDNFVKLDVNNNNVELRVEEGGLSGNGNSGTSQIQVNGVGVTGQDVTLRLVIDPNTNDIKAYYKIGMAVEFIELAGAGAMAIPAVFLTGRTLGSEDPMSFAGVFASYRNGS
ncbi:MAG: hypothetical protein AAGA62_05065, partial [Bacteroidota bacterium]